MKYRILAIALITGAALGCQSGAGGLFAKPDPTGHLEERPVTILDPNAPATTEGPSEALMEDLKRQEEAIRAGQVAAVAETPKAPPVQATRVNEETPQDAAALSALVDANLSVDMLISALSKKETRSPSEEEAYKRLLGISSRPGMESRGDDDYGLLGKARDALLEGRYQAAQEHASAALVSIRRKTDPRIDRVCFATRVRNYGDADVVESAAFRPGESVLLVTDVSDFACLPVANESPPRMHYTKMSLRIAIYDTAGKVYWQRPYGPVEYQATHYISAMFIPQVFRLPSGMPSGKYTVKVEFSDHLAARETESSTAFEIR